MTNFPFDIVGFDLDGTLLDTSADLAASVNHALVAAGRPELAMTTIVPMIGGGARDMLARALAESGGGDDAQLDAVHAAMRTHYEANICVHTLSYPGLIAALDTLAAKGVTLAVVTNKIERFAVTLLRETGLLDRFACVIGGDTMGPGMGKPSAAPIVEMIRRCGGGRAAFVGDSIYDVGAARAAGIPVVACAFGFLTWPVADLAADAAIDGFDDLIATLEQL